MKSILNNQWVVNIIGGLVVAVLGFFIVSWISKEDEPSLEMPRPISNETLEPNITYGLQAGTNYKIQDGYKLQLYWLDVVRTGKQETALLYKIQGTGLNTSGEIPTDGTLNYNSCAITKRKTDHPEIQVTLNRYPEVNSETVNASYLLSQCD